MGIISDAMKLIMNHGFTWQHSRVSVKPKSNTGISVDTDGVGVKLKSGGGILCDADGLYTEESMDPLAAYKISDIDNAGDPNYYGFEDKEGNWYIMEYTLATNEFRYDAGATGYAAAWAGRAGLSYGLFEDTF